MSDQKRSRIRNFMFLHFCILWYTMTSMLSKFASGFSFLSIGYVLCFAGLFLVLGSYAILWQQAIKPFKPSVAYSNKSISLIWTMIFSSIIFQERITVQNVIGAVIIVAGVIMVAGNE